MIRRYKYTGLVLAALAVSFLTGCGVNITQIAIPENCDLIKGDSTTLEVVYTPEQETTDDKLAEAAAKLTLTWSSADESVATVDESGTVTAVGAGTTEITAAVADTELQSACTVTVAVPLEGLKAPAALDLVANGENSAALDVELVPADATDAKLSYASSDPAIATVDANGTVTAVANGECTITASAGGSKAETSVTVTTLAEEIQLKTTEGILTVGNDFTIKATLLPETVSQPGLVWKSSDETVATVDQTGKMVAKAKGSATITVTSADGAASAEYALTVKAVKCSYCGKEGHAAANCPQKAADQKAAAQRAAQQAAAQAAQQAAAAQAAQQAAAAQAAAQAQAAQQAAAAQTPAASEPAPSGGDSGGGGGRTDGVGQGTLDEGNYVVPGNKDTDTHENEAPPL